MDFNKTPGELIKETLFDFMAMDLRLRIEDGEGTNTKVFAIQVRDLIIFAALVGLLMR